MWVGGARGHGGVKMETTVLEQQQQNIQNKNKNSNMQIALSITYRVSSVLTKNFFLFLKKCYLFIFRERGREGEREGEKHQCVVASRALSTGDLARNPGVCPDWELNWQPFGSQAHTQYTEPHQPGLDKKFQ